MTLEVPQWVRLACQRWGRQKRRIWSGRGEWYVDRLGRKTCHVDGYAESFLSRVQDEKVGAGSSSEVRQHWVEVYFGDALEVQRNLCGMPETPLSVLHLRYVFDPEFGLTAKQKSRLIGVSLSSYLNAQAVGEAWIWARLEPVDRLQPQLIDAAKETLRSGLKKPTLRQPAPLAALSLQFLQRPTLARRR
jgi:hypothetical protein